MTKQATEADRDAETVNTEAAAVPFVDLLYAESSTGTLHLINAHEAYRRRNNGYINDRDTVQVSALGGGITVEVPVDGDLADAENLTHLADEVTVDDLNENYGLMNHPWKILDSADVSQQSIASWEKAFENGEYQTVRYNLDGSGWE